MTGPSSANGEDGEEARGRERLGEELDDDGGLDERRGLGGGRLRRVRGAAVGECRDLREG